MLRALQWLLANNIYYRNVRIDPDAFTLLPEDGDITGLHSVTLESPGQEIPPTQSEDADPYNAHLVTTFVPIDVNPGMTEQETVRKSVQERQYSHVASQWQYNQQVQH